MKDELDKAALFCGMGAHNQELGNYEIAIDQYKKALKENSKYGIAWNNLGNAYRSLRKYEQALNCYQNAIESNSERFEFYLHKGVLLMELGRFSEAEQYIEQVVKINPSNLEAMFHMANISENIEKYDQAAFYSQMCLKLSPDNPPIAQCFARNLFLQGTIESAYKQLDKYIVYPNGDLNWYMVIPAALKKLNKEHEIANYFNSLNLKYNTTYFNWVKGVFQQRIGNHDLALETFTKNYENDKSDVKNIFNLAHLEYQNKNYDKAFTLANECISKGGNQREYFDIRMRAIEQTFNKNEVLKEVVKMKSLFPDDPLNIMFRYGLYLKSTIKEYHEAIHIFEEINDPQSGWSDYQIGLCYNLLNDTDRSLIHLEKAFLIDRSCRDDARFFPELDNLRENKKFKRILTFFEQDKIK